MIKLKSSSSCSWKGTDEATVKYPSTARRCLRLRRPSENDGVGRNSHRVAACDEAKREEPSRTFTALYMSLASLESEKTRHAGKRFLSQGEEKESTEGADCLYSDRRGACHSRDDKQAGRVAGAVGKHPSGSGPGRDARSISSNQPTLDKPRSGLADTSYLQSESQTGGRTSPCCSAGPH
ncbi:hypothetical protein EYF80_020604 [Liparis tanakae]|uniref:Uncharacterized protein n=1 Tax=Liparis tanakae TaxID=230148 RepID=A0A4Z2HTY3_9TELE|nr:hypothetical protein EYF80_020604 [Liparis tanakae]